MMYSLWSSSAAVTPPISALNPVPESALGTTSDRRSRTSSWVASSWGEVVGMTVIRAASPASLITGFATNWTPSCALRSETSPFRSLGEDPAGSSAAITSGPFEPGPNPSVLRS